VVLLVAVDLAAIVNEEHHNYGTVIAMRSQNYNAANIAATTTIT